MFASLLNKWRTLDRPHVHFNSAMVVDMRSPLLDEQGNEMGKNEVLSPDDAAALGRYEVGPVIAPVSLTEHLRVVTHYRLFIAIVALTVTALGAMYAFVKPRIYEGNVLIQVADMRSVEPKTLLGLTQRGSGFKRALSETEMLRSRSVVGAAVANLQLDIAATPEYFPVVGEAFARWNGKRLSPLAVPIGGYAWGAERIEVAQFELPASLLDVPFQVTALGRHSFRLRQPETGIDVVGAVGQPLDLRLGERRIALLVTALAAKPGTRFSLARRTRNAVVEEIGAALGVAEIGKETGMINVSLRDTDPYRTKAFLNELGQAYMNLLQTQKERELNESLEVLEAQLPALKRRVELAEARYESFRRRERAADLAEDTRLQLGRYSTTQGRLSELRQKRAELGARLGDAHPEIVALDRQIASASSDSVAVASSVQRVPGVSTELERRARELKAETDIYGSVLRRAEEMRVDAEDRSSNVRIVDEAVVPVKAAQSRMTIVAFAAILGLCLGIVGAYFRTLRANMRRTARQ